LIGFNPERYNFSLKDLDPKLQLADKFFSFFRNLATNYLEAKIN